MLKYPAVAVCVDFTPCSVLPDYMKVILCAEPRLDSRAVFIDTVAGMKACRTLNAILHLLVFQSPVGGV